MNRMLLGLVCVAACSGQMCGTGNDSSGPQNICERTYFNSTYRVGMDLPAGVSAPVSGETNSSVVLKLTWDWAVELPAKFVLVVSAPTGGTTLQQVSTDSRTAFEQNGFTVMQSMQVALDDQGDAWYFALSPDDQENINVETVMTITQGRLVSLSATYSSTLPQERTDAIGAALRSLCADVK